MASLEQAHDRLERAIALENLVDAIGLAEVLDMLADICGSKADHIEHTWQDKATAKLWAHVAKRIDAIRALAEAEKI